MTDRQLLEVMHTNEGFTKLYRQFQALVYPGRTDVLENDLKRTELHLLGNKYIRLYWEDPVKHDFILNDSDGKTNRGV